MPNRLAQSQSLYLRKHADNPIDWWTWCDEAFLRAQQENKPIFLSIGYSSCHWCTVMEGEAFSDPSIARYMNANFLPIKVDREERPDLDSIYMQALQMMAGQGGWPLNVFLDHEDRVPFYGGTYFPLEPLYGRPGFLQLLQAIRRYYDTETAKLRSIKQELLSHLEAATIPQNSDTAFPIGNELLEQGLETNTGVISFAHSGPSFPMIPYSDMALRGIRFDFSSEYDARQACAQRGVNLAQGGIYDHVAGGFHRYTVDPSWTVPHFEKMLYDNGQIVEYLANLWSYGCQESAFKRAIAGTIQWLKREMTAPEGYFYASQDADNFTDILAKEPEEGAFYVWSYAELNDLLSAEELAELKQQFSITETGNFEQKNVLQRFDSEPLSASVERSLAKLFEMRYGCSAEELETFTVARDNQEAKTFNWLGRIPPVTDIKMIVSWNSLMISGLARAYAVFGEQSYLDLAVKAVNFILKNQWINGRLQRLNYQGKAEVFAQSEDYALLIKALLDLHQATLNIPDSLFSIPNLLEKAIEIQAEFTKFFWSLELGGYFNTAADVGRDLLVRERSYTDNATPSANGVAITNLIRLTLLTSNLEYLQQGERALQAFSSVMHSSPQACPSLFTALDWYLNCTLIRSTESEISNLISQYQPSAIFALTSDLPTGAVGLVCQGLQCLEPAFSYEQLQQQIRESQLR